MEKRIAVVCDDQSHARGKVRKIETFVKMHEGSEFWLPAEMFAPKRDPHGWNDHSSWGDLGEMIHTYDCPLCGLKLECGNKVLQWALDAIGRQGVSETTLKSLVLIASRRT